MCTYVFVVHVVCFFWGGGGGGGGGIGRAFCMLSSYAVLPAENGTPAF